MEWVQLEWSNTHRALPGEECKLMSLSSQLNKHMGSQKVNFQLKLSLHQVLGLICKWLSEFCRQFANCNLTPLLSTNNVNPEQITTSKQTTLKASTSTPVHMKGTRVQQSQHTGNSRCARSAPASRTVCVDYLKAALENSLAFERQSNLVSFPSPWSRVNHLQ